MKNIIKKIISGNENDIIAIYEYTKNKLFLEGPTSTSVLEILSYLAKFRADFFQKNIDEILNFMGLFYKTTSHSTLKEHVFKIFSETIETVDSFKYTPVQSNIANEISMHKNFSFSAPTSTGKSFVFNNIITSSKNDIVIIVPSRALINEYFNKLYKSIPDKYINILTTVDIINTKYARRNIFILTPERTKEIFKFNEYFNIDFFLFDEAQLGNEKSFRGLFFDSIIRRIQTHFPDSKCIFAHPFIENPEAQFIKNNFNTTTSLSKNYTQKNVGQIFYTHSEDKFCHFGIERDIMGSSKLKSDADPIKECLENGGSVLIYTSKSSIYNKSIFYKFKNYIELCSEIDSEHGKSLILRLREMIGASTSSKDIYVSNMINMLRFGIVTHHGSLPLKARLLLEEFTQNNFCRMCFATSTLEQGVNMPFDIVYLNRLDGSKSLSVKNLIGRAGRSTVNTNFDYGVVIIKENSLSRFRKLMLSSEKLETESQLDNIIQNDDYKEFKEAIINGTFSDEYNLPNSEVKLLSENTIYDHINTILRLIFNQSTENAVLEIKYSFVKIYEHYLKRSLYEGEKCVFEESIYLFLLRLRGNKFQDICKQRFNKAYSKKFVQAYADIPQKFLNKFPLFTYDTKTQDIDYDRIVFDTYDYFDKLISFKLSDIFYTIFDRFHKNTGNLVAKKLALHFKYGSDDDKTIMLLKYGLSIDEIEEFLPYIESVTKEELVVNSDIYALPDEKLTYIKRFIHN